MQITRNFREDEVREQDTSKANGNRKIFREIVDDISIVLVKIIIIIVPPLRVEKEIITNKIYFQAKYLC